MDELKEAATAVKVEEKRIFNFSIPINKSEEDRDAYEDQAIAMIKKSSGQPPNWLYFKMSIIYSVICRQSYPTDDIVILAHYDSATGNYSQVLSTLLKKMTEQHTKITFEYGT